MRETIRMTYNGGVNELPEARAKVFYAISDLGECTDQQIAEYLGIGINLITPRRLELERSGLICTKNTVLNHKNRSVNLWQVSEETKETKNQVI